ncbi:TldD/PmbA family protein [candidate division WOR-3 bacterium]|nr:TldD/PmbA family protein [candidate division WOR-3 bacterium]
MKKLLELAKRQSDMSEVYVSKVKITPLTFENGELQNINLKHYIEIGLRIIRNSKLGTSFGTSLKEPEKLVEQAVFASKYGPKIEYKFPKESSEESYNNYDPEIENFPIEKLAEDGVSAIKWYTNKGVKTPVNVYMVAASEELNILNTSGLFASHKMTEIVRVHELILKGSGSGPYIEDEWYTYRKCDTKKLEQLLKIYQNAQKECKVPTRPMKVMFTPNAMHVIYWRLYKAISGDSLLEHISPLEGKLGKKIFDERVSIYENPHIKNCPASRPFDDEGVKTQVLPIIENGVFKNFIFDLRTAQEYGTQSTGNGYKTTMWGGSISTPVTPHPCHLVFKPGDLSLADQIKAMDEGIILNSPIGAHSGNIPAGQFSVNVGLGYYVKDGVIQGRAIDAMVSGNIYDNFQNLHSISKELDFYGRPWLLFNNMSVAGKK